MNAAGSSYRVSFSFVGPQFVNDHLHLHVKIHADRLVM